LRISSGGLLACWLAACAADAGERDPKPEVKVATQTYDPAGRPTKGTSLSELVWGLGDSREAREASVATDVPQEPESRPTGASQPSPASQPTQDAEKRRQEEALARTRFGPNIVIGGDGKITKQFFLSGEASSVFLALISEPRPPSQAAPVVPPPAGAKFGGAQPSQSVLGRMLGDHEVELYFVQDFERMETTDIVAKVTGVNPRPPVGNANSLLLVTAKSQALEAFESALNLFFGNIPQIEIEVKVIEFNVTDSLNFGVVQTDANTPLLSSIGSDLLVKSLTSTFPLNAPLLGGNSINDRGSLVLGGVHNGWALAARLQALQVENKVDIKSSPRMVVRNGGLASITTTTSYPFPEARIYASGTNVTTNIAFKPVGITLNIRPVIAGTKVVILQIYADVSAVTGFAATDPVSTPIISNRNAVTSVHVLDGQTTVIGGLITQAQLENESKIPLLGDIPILGILFRSATKNQSKTDLRFHITPHILEGPRGFKSDDQTPGG